MQARLIACLQPDVTDLDAGLLEARHYIAFEPGAPGLRALGIEIVAGAPTVLLTNPSRPLGSIRIAAHGHNNVIAIDNTDWSGTCIASMRLLGTDSVVMMNDIADGFVRIEDMLMRSHEQVLYWGIGATAVGVSLEFEGTGRRCVIGDDALISNDVWIRNYDMHAFHDLASGAQINRQPCDTVLERHVWLGQDALLLNCERVGMGSIVGARAMVKGFVPRHSVAAGTPARVLRQGTSWGRSSLGMTDAERVSIGLMPLG
jgi:hypothetical protein